MGQHLVGIETNLNLARRTADDLDLTDAAHAFERLLDQFVGQPRELLERARAGDDQLQDRRGVGIELLDDRGEGRFRQRRNDEVDLVAHVLGRDVAVFLEEKRPSPASALDRGRAKLVDAADLVERPSSFS